MATVVDVNPITNLTAEEEAAKEAADEAIMMEALMTIPDFSDDEADEGASGLRAGEDIAVANTFLLKAELGKSEADHDH